MKSLKKSFLKQTGQGPAASRGGGANLFVNGFRVSAIASGIKKSRRKDLALIVSDVPARAAGVFTQNSVPAAPVVLDRKRICRALANGVIINSGNANACTGRAGYEDARKMVSLAEGALGLCSGRMLVASTGVIGIKLPIGKIKKGIKRLAGGLRPTGWNEAATAIMTTDSFAKTAVARKKIGGREVTIVGIAKGAGMISPNMATMLAFFATDAKINNEALQQALRLSTDRTFNRISVDNDTSTNDTALIFANGLAGGAEIVPGSRGSRLFTALLEGVSRDLARMIVLDGEGATRFVELVVLGAETAVDAETAARKLAGSLLVKTALFGGDPNWGRIMAALGSTSVKLNPGAMKISLNNVTVVRAGLDTGSLKRAAAALKSREVRVTIELGAGTRAFTIWTTDLSYEYVRINSSYRS